MKLNNKGFAFSTMLYGTLSLIAVVLFAVLAISKKSRDETLYFGESIEKKLNECVYDEIALENCYTAGVTECDSTSYLACLGINKKELSTTKELIADTLKKAKVTTGDGLRDDPYSDKRLIYYGTNVNNYIEYANKKWRILSVEPDGTIRIVDYQANIQEKWDKNADYNWINSSLKSYLNNEYLNSLSDTSKLVSGKWKATMIYPSYGSPKLSMQDIVKLNNEQDTTATFYTQVNILSIEDYMNATTNSACRTNTLETTGCAGWLSNYKGWTVNFNAEITDSSVAYFLNDNNQMDLDNTASPHSIFPVVILARTSEIEKGTGTVTDPYILK